MDLNLNPWIDIKFLDLDPLNPWIYVKSADFTEKGNIITKDHLARKVTPFI